MSADGQIIPEDVRVAAEAVLESAHRAITVEIIERTRSGNKTVRDIYVAEISKVILAERERCAVIAEGNAKSFDFQRAFAEGDDLPVGAKSVQLAIARKIRGEA
ncbi:hypothetical protein FHT86_002182 [Rhizobium sp. BK313]|uniref:hypothetical protein n=1 Tax=Rhizobium sp. BK313 TaxID=2587081 RepID=UPI001610E6C0|nr:hypothetical protein [Rhizobium sp. BK313]MBB3453926.1 hypothetical protein [Rhizobium sp. BK313]